MFADNMQCRTMLSQLSFWLSSCDGLSVFSSDTDLNDWCSAKRLQLNRETTELLWFGPAVAARRHGQGGGAPPGNLVKYVHWYLQ